MGLGNFDYLLALPTVWQVFANTLIIAILKIAGGTVLPIVVSLLLNEVRSGLFRRSVQTIIYFPYFISWIVFGGIMVDLLSPNDGIVNQVIVALGFEPAYFLGDVDLFRGSLVVTDVWKTFGFITVIYLAAITSIDPTLYEVASIDGRRALAEGVAHHHSGHGHGDRAADGAQPGQHPQRRLRAGVRAVQPAGVRDRRHHRHPGLPARPAAGAVRGGHRGGGCSRA